MFNLKWLFSRNVWTLIALYLLNHVGPIHELVPPAATPIVDGILTILGIYFRVKPKQIF